MAFYFTSEDPNDLLGRLCSIQEEPQLTQENEELFCSTGKHEENRRSKSEKSEKVVSLQINRRNLMFQAVIENKNKKLIQATSMRLFNDVFK